MSSRRAAVAIFCLASACGVGGKSVVRQGMPRPPYAGDVKIYWEGLERPTQGTFEVVGQISGYIMGMGKQGRGDPDLQHYIVSEAAKLGGDGVIISCGAPGTVGERDCTGIAIHTKATGQP